VTASRTGSFNDEHCECKIHTTNFEVALGDEGRQSFNVNADLSWTVGKYCHGKNLQVELAEPTRYGVERSFASADSLSYTYYKFGEGSGSYCTAYTFFVDGEQYSRD